MKSSSLKNFPKIFSFTFSQHVSKNVYKYTTIIIALICLFLPTLIMAVVEYSASNQAQNDSGTAVDVAVSCSADTIHVIDSTANPQDAYSFMNDLGIEGFSEFFYVSYGSESDRAIEEAGRKTLLLFIDKPENDYSVSVVLPENTDLTIGDADAYRNFISANFQNVLLNKAGIDIIEAVDLSVPVAIDIVTDKTSDLSEDGQASGSEGAKMLLSIILPYLNIMVLYFMILFYGQGVANSVIMEKTSKLMDTILISVKPAAMVAGKVFAIAFSGILQLAVWISCIVGSFVAGTYIVKAINPNTTMGLIMLFDNLHIFSGIFSLPTVVIAISITLSGFLLYCSLAAIGGSLASKPEDLSSTNVLFTLALIISFFITLNPSEMGSFASSKQWVNFFPFTAILVTPSRVILGDISIAASLVSLAIVLISSFALMLLAGKIYTLMSLYKGNPPSIRRVIEMLRTHKSQGDGSSV